MSIVDLDLGISTSTIVSWRFTLIVSAAVILEPVLGNSAMEVDELLVPLIC